MKTSAVCVIVFGQWELFFLFRFKIFFVKIYLNKHFVARNLAALA